MKDSSYQKKDGYFRSLPPYVKETLTQSGIDWSSDVELRDIVNNLTKGKHS